jgi:hypothetical protein
VTEPHESGASNPTHNDRQPNCSFNAVIRLRPPHSSELISLREVAEQSFDASSERDSSWTIRDQPSSDA